MKPVIVWVSKKAIWICWIRGGDGWDVGAGATPYIAWVDHKYNLSGCA